MVAKLNSKTQFQILFRFFEPFRRVLLQCLQKKFKNATWISKNAEFDADFVSVEIVAKNYIRKKLLT